MIPSIWRCESTLPYFIDLEGKTDVKIRALEEVEELRTTRADKQVLKALKHLPYVGYVIDPLELPERQLFPYFNIICGMKYYSRRIIFWFFSNVSQCFFWMLSTRIVHLFLSPWLMLHNWRQQLFLILAYKKWSTRN